jgi:hypothetical protein
MGGFMQPPAAALARTAPPGALEPLAPPRERAPQPEARSASEGSASPKVATNQTNRDASVVWRPRRGAQRRRDAPRRESASVVQEDASDVQRARRTRDSGVR